MFCLLTIRLQTKDRSVNSYANNLNHSVRENAKHPLWSVLISCNESDSVTHDTGLFRSKTSIESEHVSSMQ